MNTTLLRRAAALLCSMALAASLGLVVGVASVAAATDVGCTALGGDDSAAGVDPAGICEVNALVAVSGVINVGEPLHLRSGAHLDATGSATTPALTLNVTGSLTMEAGSIIEADDDSPPLSGDGASAKNITIHTTGSLTMAAGSRISADNNVKLGTGGEILITVDGNMSMAGTAGTDNCRTDTSGPGFYQYLGFGVPNVYGDPTLGARISAYRLGGSGSDSGGHINITVGNYGVPPSGTLTMDRCSLIDVSSAGQAGQIEITAGRVANLDGLVLSESGQSGTGTQTDSPRGGGPINVRAGCNLHVSGTGVISSKGQDPGADLVHLKGCDVLIEGVVQSTAPGAGHVLPVSGGVPTNLCNKDNVAHPLATPTNASDPAEGFTACVRIIGQKVKIDGLNANGNVNTDGIRAPMRTWIDIFSDTDITALGKPDGSGVKWAISANACPPPASAPCSNAYGGIVTLKAVHGKVVTSGQAILQANASAGGGDGGLLTIQAGGGGSGTPATPDATSNIELDGSFLEANGPGGDTSAGGYVAIKSFNGSITSGGDGSGHIEALGGHPADATPPPFDTRGQIVLEECNSADTYTGTVSASGSVSENRSVCNGIPTLPSDAQALVDSNRPIWNSCTPAPPEKSGYKFNDLNGNHAWDKPTEPGLNTWTIHAYDETGTSDLKPPVITGNNPVTGDPGFYKFQLDENVIYHICEDLKPGWTQTFPVAGPANVVPCPGGTLGYKVQLANGQNEADNNFGNHQDVACQKQTAIDIMNSAFPKNLGPDITVKTWAGDKVQDAVDTVTDLNKDGYLIIMVIANSDGSLGGSANQKVVISKDYTATPATNLPFGLLGCSVTLTGGGSGAAVSIASTANAKDITINSRTSDIFVADLHGGSSAVGVWADGNNRYLRNEQAFGNTGIGIKVTGNDNTVHNGAAGDKGKGNGGDGVYVYGRTVAGVFVPATGNLLTDTNAMANTGNGFNVVGNNNTLRNLDAGDKGKGNGADGIHLVGFGNYLEANDAIANTGDGFDIAGGTSGSPNRLKNNASSGSGSGLENTGAEYRILDWIKNDGGGNKVDGTTLPSAAKFAAGFPASGASKNFPIATFPTGAIGE